MDERCIKTQNEQEIQGFTEGRERKKQRRTVERIVEVEE
jgi:hypothetical protein